MKQVWAPWRKQYIEQGKSGGCIFCDKSSEGDDKKNHIIKRGKTCFSILNRFPYNGGHLMVAPNRHTPKLYDSPPEHASEMMELIKAAGPIAMFLALLLMAASASSWRAGLWMAALLGLCVPTLYLIVLLEERELRDRFGEEYEAYCRRVPRFVPKRG